MILTYVELGTIDIVSLVESDDLVAHKILARWDTRREGEVDETVRSDHAVNAPCLRGDVEAVLPDLEPLEVGDILLKCVVDFGAVHHTVGSVKENHQDKKRRTGM